MAGRLHGKSFFHGRCAPGFSDGCAVPFGCPAYRLFPSGQALHRGLSRDIVTRFAPCGIPRTPGLRLAHSPHRQRRHFMPKGTVAKTKPVPGSQPGSALSGGMSPEDRRSCPSRARSPHSSGCPSGSPPAPPRRSWTTLLRPHPPHHAIRPRRRRGLAELFCRRSPFERMIHNAYQSTAPDPLPTTRPASMRRQPWSGAPSIAFLIAVTRLATSASVVSHEHIHRTSLREWSQS